MFNFLNINECSSDPCGDHEYCEDGIGSYTCKCEKGYLNNGHTCQGNLITKRVFIWRTGSSLGRASHMPRGLDFTSRLHGKNQSSYPGWLA